MGAGRPAGTLYGRVWRLKRARLSSLDPERFPNVIAAADALADCRSQDDYYERGVGMLVRGVVALRPAAHSG